jgi:hypothetical protein
MGPTNRTINGSICKVDIFYQGESIYSASSVVLDAMNITIDKERTIGALTRAESDLMRRAQLVREVTQDEELAKSLEDEAGVLSALLLQVKSHGKDESNGERVN